MKITFAFDDVSFKPFASPYAPKVKSFEFQSLRFTLRVEPDPEALSEIAEPVPFDYPPRAHPNSPNDLSLNCDTIKKRNFPPHPSTALRTGFALNEKSRSGRGCGAIPPFASPYFS